MFTAKPLGKDNENFVIWHFHKGIRTLAQSVATRVMEEMRCESLSARGKGYLSLSAYVSILCQEQKSKQMKTNMYYNLKKIANRECSLKLRRTE